MRFATVSALTAAAVFFILSAYATVAVAAAGGVCRQSSDCDDANPCTLDWCDAVTGCVHRATPCDCVDRRSQFAKSPLLDLIIAISVPLNAERIDGVKRQVWNIISRSVPTAPAASADELISVSIDAASGTAAAANTKPAAAPVTYSRFAIVTLHATSKRPRVHSHFTSDTAALNQTLTRVWELAATASTPKRKSDKPITDWTLAVLKQLKWLASKAQTVIASRSGGDGSLIFRDVTVPAPETTASVNPALATTNHILLIVDPPSHAIDRVTTESVLAGSPDAKRDLALNSLLDEIGRAFTTHEVGLTIVLHSGVSSPIQNELERVMGLIAADNHYSSSANVPGGDGWAEGFNRALTLAKYDLRAGEERGGAAPSAGTAASIQTNPLQARLLRNRNYCRIIEAYHFSTSFQVDILSAVLPVHPSQFEWCNECSVGRCRRAATENGGSGCYPLKKQCGKNQSCLPAVGCKPLNWHSDLTVKPHPTEAGSKEAVSHAAPSDVVFAKTGEHIPLIKDRKEKDAAAAADTDAGARAAQGGATAWTKRHIVKSSHVPILEWSPDKPFASYLIDQRNEPVILRRSVVSSWAAASKWQDWKYVQSTIGQSEFKKVKTTRDWLVFDIDQSAPLSRLSSLDTRVHYQHIDLSADEFFQKIQKPEDDSVYYYFGNMTEALKADVQPSRPMFLDDYDFDRYEQYLWISSRGPCMHTHFDNDRNLFVQLVGEKLFTLWPPSELNRMYPFPRVHPLWHKSQAHFNRPDLTHFPDYRRTRAIQAHLKPGDLLYIPPYWWHHVESLTASISLSTWSRYNVITESMSAAWGKGLYADGMKQWTHGVHALRLFIDMLITDLFGKNMVTEYVSNLVRTRYYALRDTFPHSTPFAPVTSSSGGGESVVGGMPTGVCSRGFNISQSSLAAIEFDVRCLVQAFAKLPPEIRDFNLADYIEQIAIDMVGPRHVYAFFRFCFGNGDTSEFGAQHYIPDDSALSVDEVEAKTMITAAGKPISVSDYNHASSTEKYTKVMSPAERAALDEVRALYWKPTDIDESNAREIGRI